MQAEKRTLRKAIRQNGKAIVNMYELDDDFANYRILKFDGESEQWLDIVCDCRAGKPVNTKYDIIFGNMECNDAFKTVDIYYKSRLSE